MSKRVLYLVIGIPAAIIVLVVIAAIIVTVQGTYRTASVDQEMPSAMPPYDMGMDGDYAVSEEAGRGVAVDNMYPYPEPTAGQTAADVEQKIIKTGSLDIVVDNVSESTARIIALATGKGGFVQDSSVTERADGTHYGTVTVRIPASTFEATMEEIKALANVVVYESANGQDVTEEYTDLEARLGNAKAQEEQYLQILEKAITVEDILSVQRELGYIRSEIESLEGRVQYLKNMTSLSTISAYLSEEPTVSIPTKEFRPLTIIKEAGRALVGVVQWVATAIIWIVIAVGPFAVIAWLVMKAVKMYRKGKKK